MTGRGTGIAASRRARVEVELSSVNRKQFDVAVGLPRFLSGFESRVQACIQARMSRGRITGDIRVAWAQEARASFVRIDEGLAEGLIHALRSTAVRLGLPDDLQASALLSIPELVEFGRDAEEIETLWPLVERALAAALAGLHAMRRREGQVLARDLRQRLKTLSGQMQAIRALAPGVVDAYRAALLRRMAEALPGTDWAEDERLRKDVVLFADRSDITEELVRLDSHVRQARGLLRTGGVIGRSLDFLVQEMGREVNTIGAKANDAQIARRVVVCKSELERFREQVQNIE